MSTRTVTTTNPVEPPAICGYSYLTQPYGGGTRYHCPQCDVRRNEYGIPMVGWTNGHTHQRFCNNIVIHKTHKGSN